MSIIISVNPPHSGLLVDGIKEIEWRKRFLPRGKAFIYETKKHGGIGAVIGEVEIGGGFCVFPDFVGDELIRAGRVDREFLKKDAGGESVWANNVDVAIRYKEPRPLSDFGLKRPPQSWCYVEPI